MSCEFLGALQEGTGNGLFRVLLKGVHLEGFAFLPGDSEVEHIPLIVRQQTPQWLDAGDLREL